ncbi:MAG: hypothetical protein RR766_09555, partial [Longicatena sp.]
NVLVDGTEVRGLFNYPFLKKIGVKEEINEFKSAIEKFAHSISNAFKEDLLKSVIEALEV